MLHHHPFYEQIKKLQKTYGEIVNIEVVNYATESRLEPEWYWNTEQSGGWFITSEIHWFHLFVWLTGNTELSIRNASEEKIENRTIKTKCEAGVLEKQSLSILHKLNSSDEEIKCFIKIDFKNGKNLVINGWIPETISSDNIDIDPATPDIKTRDEMYSEMIKKT